MRLVHAPVEVVAVAGGDAWVVAMPGAGCAPCASGRGCGAHAGLTRLHPEERARALRVRAGPGYEVGERAWLRVSARGLAAGAALLFGLPLSGFLLGAYAGPALLESIGMAASSSDWLQAASAALGLGAAALGVRCLLTGRGEGGWLNPSLVKKVPQ